VAHTPHVIN